MKKTKRAPSSSSSSSSASSSASLASSSTTNAEPNLRGNAGLFVRSMIETFEILRKDATTSRSTMELDYCSVHKCLTESILLKKSGENVKPTNPLKECSSCALDENREIVFMDTTESYKELATTWLALDAEAVSKEVLNLKEIVDWKMKERQAWINLCVCVFSHGYQRRTLMRSYAANNAALTPTELETITDFDPIGLDFLRFYQKKYSSLGMFVIACPDHGGAYGDFYPYKPVTRYLECGVCEAEKKRVVQPDKPRQTFVGPQLFVLGVEE